MRVGIDFDNTIARYDDLFHRVCRDAGLIPESLPRSKSAVRDHLRETGREEDWTELQGVVYGPRIVEAEPFPGVAGFIRAALARGIPLSIISHKTKHPYRGEKHDLHAAARRFLRHHGLVGEGALGEEDVFLEPTKEAKAERIRRLGCTHFIDDLPEFLELVTFAGAGQRLLFDPNDHYPDLEDWWRCRSWDEIAGRLL